MIKGAYKGIKWRNDGTGLGDADYLPGGVVMHDLVNRLPIKGAKAGQQKQHKPVVAQDSASSISTLKILYGLSEGEISGLADGAKSIYLDDTPILDANGNPNFKNSNGSNAVVWDFRTGTNDQEYIKGFPSVENETNINVELKGGTPYVKTVTNSQLSAVRLRLSWSALREQKENGDVVGVTIEYAVDLSTNGNAYQTVLLTKVSDKTSAKYERSHRIDLPRGSTWTIRVRRLTPNATSDLISDKMYVDAITEIIDAKLRYPNTAMLGLQYNAATFSNVAKLSVRCKGKIISVPSNYDPVARTYTGVWNGTFKQAYSNNPAWVYYDICTQWRYGLGSRITAAMIDKWSLYALAQYCDEKVSDGKGGQEPRFAVNVYLQAQQDAFAVLQSLSAIFRAMSYWQGEQIVLDADLPKDPVYTFSRANVVDGEFSYTGTRARDRHTIAKVAWDNPEQKFKTEYEFVRDEAAIAKYGVKVLDLSIVGCTSQGQAQRAGLWALKSEQLETRTVTFKTGLDGFIPTVGSIINVSDEVLAARANSGRVSAVSANLSTITLDRDVTVNVGDTLIINADNGKAQRRIVSSVSGRNVTVSVAFDGVSSQNVWAVDSSDLKTMRFRVLSIKQDDVTFTITALQHEPQKYDAIDYGAIVHDTTGGIRPAPIPQSIAAPSFVTLSQRNRTEQTQNITTLIIAWGQVSGAIAYNVEWRKDDGDWQNVYNVNKNSVEVDGVYAGNYVARVRAISAYGAVSEPVTSNIVTITGKTQKPSKNLQLTAVGILFGMRLRWVYPANSTDTNYTEIQMATEPDTNVSDLGKFAYPTDTHTMQGLAGNLTLFFRARLVDKVGNVGEWTDWAEGTTSADAKAVLDLLSGQIKESQLYQDLGAKIAKISTIETGLSQEIENRVDAQAQEAIDRSNAINQETENRIAAVKVNADAIASERDARINAVQSNTDAISQETQSRIAAIKSVSDGLTQEIIDRQNGDAETLQVITTYKASNDNAMAAVQSDVRTVTTAQSATASKLDGVYAIVTPLTADSVLWTADSGTKQATAWTLQSAIVDGDSALSQRIDVLNASFNSNNAAIITEQIARADADSALSSRINSYVAQTDSSIATIKQDVKTQADETSANSSAITALDNRVSTIDTNTNTAMQNAASAVSKAETAVTQAGSASSLAQTASATATNAQSVANTAKSTADTAKSTADTANTNAATAVSKATAAADSASATASTLQQVQADLAGKASAGAVTAVDGKVTELGGKVTANTTKLDGVYAIVTPLTADSVLWTADSGTKTATAWTLQSAYATADMALSQKIDNVSSTYNDSLASVQRETKTVSDKYSALATDVNIIKAAQAGNLSFVMDNYYTKTTTDQTIAQKITTFKADIVDPALKQKADAGALQETTAKADRIDGQLQAASTKLDGVYAKVSPLTADSNNWRADSGSKAATAWTLQSAIADSERVVSKRVDALSAELDNDIASIRTTQQALTTTSLSQAVKIESLGASFANADNRLGTNEAAIRTEQEARASGDRALAQQITTLSTTSSELVQATADHDEYIKQNTATIQQQQQTINGLYARWSIKVDINGRISGIGFAASGDTSDFAVRADKFYIAPPDGYGKGDTPFIVLSTAQQVGDTIVPAGTYIKSAYIHEASIDTLKIRSQAVSVVASVTQSPFGAVGTTQYIYIDSQGGSIKVDLNMVGFGANGSGNINFYVNGSLVTYYGYNFKGEEPTSFLSVIVSGGYGMTAICVNFTGNCTMKQYMLTATALKR